MSDYSTTPNLGLFKPTFNADVGNWGAHWNTNADTLDSALATSGGLFLPLSGGQLSGQLAMSGNRITAVGDAAAAADAMNQRASDARYLRLSGAALLGNYTNDAAAAAGGVIVGQFYRNGSVVMQRVA